MKRNWIYILGLVCATSVGLVAGRMSTEGAPVSAGSIAEKQSNTDTTARTLDNPIIGIASLTGDTYVRAIRECGGTPIVLPNTDGSADQIDEYLVLLDGLIMPGGADIPPSEWGEEPHPTTSVLDDERYQFEKALINAWIDQTDKPLLGICLGSQWINVAHGGSLIQDIPSEFGISHRNVTHKVTLEQDCKLASIFDQTEFEVNSFHHQAVGRLGNGLRVVARSPEGIVEATETTDPDRFLIGVQWHPEKMMPESEFQTRLLQAFVDEAAKVTP